MLLGIFNFVHQWNVKKLEKIAKENLKLGFRGQSLSWELTWIESDDMTVLPEWTGMYKTHNDTGYVYRPLPRKKDTNVLQIWYNKVLPFYAELPQPV